MPDEHDRMSLHGRSTRRFQQCRENIAVPELFTPASTTIPGPAGPMVVRGANPGDLVMVEGGPHTVREVAASG
jgi:hypothetical protein